MKKKTIANELVFEGIGLHTGEKTKIRIVPSDKGHIIFKKQREELLAELVNVMETRRGVVLKNNSFYVYTVEHLLSALYGMEIDSVYVILEKGSEIPAMDGSSFSFAHAFFETGTREIEQDVDFFIPKKSIEYKKGKKSISLFPSHIPQVTYYIAFPQPVGTQVFRAHLYNAEMYLENIAKARTFIFEHEIENVKAMGLARGGSFENTLVFTENGVYNGKLRFPDEPVRHKILDFIGDMVLLGKRIKGSFLVQKAGHSEHVDFIKMLEVKNAI